ncbi:MULTISPECIES: UDP-N-acetyl-D-mannosamine dehydrogenase [Aeromonas]|uniref:UDP-N-acetyl-D-mannosamine dehydrogenase n=1 Tax=Aeromonas TaxID=642 RepID=UPI0028DEAC50|nr:UDP-N-acetyl-D-mannosamine dehydrogenase [Aeromonas caviae]MDX7675659.1 UDP-N-acetyl-D-mannosamine dehydrogenase [Aeromonas caviae]MDX7712184.1 UDP-N-acetyl-D-mannosamine dehydrogenase [Aeromonas caviae]HEA3084666.1 UDP-N-acetyl-D-mannosamine dehydrogenase [Aeromonas dhakensis]
MTFDRVSIIGLGYIGLPTAAVIASNGIRVLGFDVNHHTVDTINHGKIHIVEPGLEELVRSAVDAGYLTAHTTPQQADIFLVAVPTPFKGDNREPDLSFIQQAAICLAPCLESGNLVILESTSPVGTTEQMANWLAEVRPDLTFPHTAKAGSCPDIQIAYCPERVLPGHVVRELVDNDRIIGGLDTVSTERAMAFYRLFVKNGDCIATTARTAEMSKLAENSFRDVNIAFANELSLICDRQGIDVWELISLANRHPRVNILQPGCGVGGHCIAVDPWFIVNQNPDLSQLIRQARLVNDYKPLYVVEQIETALSVQSGRKIACLGLSFKANIDDLRESPALNIVRILARDQQNELLVVEPHISALPNELSNLGNVKLVTLEQALEQADVVVQLVKHQQFSDVVTMCRQQVRYMKFC